jgi:putative endonuclease
MSTQDIARQNTTQLGKKGEGIAINYLLSQGYTILERNYRWRRGEIDIVARDQKVLAFIEVKYYKVNSLRDLETAVDWRKQKKIIQTAQHYLIAKKLGEILTRFDVVLVAYAEQSAVYSVKLFKDAFRG